MLNIYYLSGDQNSKIDFTSWPYWMQTGDFLDYEKSCTESQNRIREIKNVIRERYLTISVCGANEQDYYDNLNRLHEVFEKDVANLTPGRLYFQGAYQTCYVVASTKTEWEDTDCMLDAEIRIIPVYPSWITEQQISIKPITDSEESTDNSSYPYTYPYTYGMPSKTTSVKIDHYAASDFRMIVYGPTANVSVTINGHIYHVEYPIEDDEYMVIDSRSFLPPDERIYLVRQNGEKVNVFNYRDPEHSIFQKIPAGDITIDYSRKYGIDLIVFLERSEPKWK